MDVKLTVCFLLLLTTAAFGQSFTGCFPRERRLFNVRRGCISVRPLPVCLGLCTRGIGRGCCRSFGLRRISRELFFCRQSPRSVLVRLWVFTSIRCFCSSAPGLCPL